jgi:TRAP-type mannitol/chloroaromatic compound transport system permease small subunit
MHALLGFSRGVDAMNALFGRVADWLVLSACAISAGNAAMRYGFSLSSNAWLEVQWYLFAAIVMLGLAYVLQKNAHVRIDFVSSRLRPRTRVWVDIFGIVFFLFPLCYVLIQLSWPMFMHAYESGEMSPHAGGLIRWPALILIPIGLALFFAQGASELIKRIAFLSGHAQRPFSEHAEAAEH